MKWLSSGIPLKVITILSLISFVPFVFLIFNLLFANCYIDDGCGRIDPFVPFIVVAGALAASLLTGYLGALFAKALSDRE
jgi:hypothetical protein